MTEAEYELLSRIEQGECVFRTKYRVDGPLAFSGTVDVLIALRDHGWIHLPEGRISRDGQGRPLVAGPCDLTEAGRRALEDDRRLGPRAS